MTDFRHPDLPEDVVDASTRLDGTVTLSDLLLLADGLRKTEYTTEGVTERERINALAERLRAQVDAEVESQRHSREVRASLEEENAAAQEQLAALLVEHPERAKLKVYRWSHGGRGIAIAATTSKAKAAALVGETVGRMWDFTITGNVHDRLQALSKPETVFVTESDIGRNPAWRIYEPFKL